MEIKQFDMLMKLEAAIFYLKYKLVEALFGME